MIVGGPPAAEIPHTVLQAVLAAEAEEDSDDDLSEEGKQNLKEYLEWQAEQEKSLRHNEIMDLFGSKGEEGVQFGSSRE